MRISVLLVRCDILIVADSPITAAESLLNPYIYVGSFYCENDTAYAAAYSKP